jgi:hypothetical protein
LTYSTLYIWLPRLQYLPWVICWEKQHIIINSLQILRLAYSLS